jgi:hypothetical protein
MATIHTYKEAKATSQGLWVKSADGGPEIFLTTSEAIALAQEIMKQAKPGSSTPARSAQRKSAPTVTRRAAAPALYSAPSNRETGTRVFTGKSSFHDEKWRDHAISLAKGRAEKHYKSMLQRLEAENKVCNVTAKGAPSVNGNAVTYTITATLE